MRHSTARSSLALRALVAMAAGVLIRSLSRRPAIAITLATGLFLAVVQPMSSLADDELFEFGPMADAPTPTRAIVFEENLTVAGLGRITSGRRADALAATLGVTTGALTTLTSAYTGFGLAGPGLEPTLGEFADVVDRHRALLAHFERDTEPYPLPPEQARKVHELIIDGNRLAFDILGRAARDDATHPLARAARHAEHGELALAWWEIGDAADAFGKAANVVPAGDAMRRGHYLARRGYALQRLDRLRGGTRDPGHPNLNPAIETYQ